MVSWAKNLDRFEETIERAETALGNGQFAPEGWDLFSIDFGPDDPSDADRARFMELSARADEVVRSMQTVMSALQNELSNNATAKEAGRAYGQAGAIERHVQNQKKLDNKPN